MKSAVNLLSLALGLGQLRGANTLDDGIGLKPHMGWSSWNVAQCDAASAKYALDTAAKFISLGLKDLGYEYINIDDCWSTGSRDSTTGKLVPDPKKWPDGINAVSDEIHNMGLKFGLYGCAGDKTCAGYPGSEGHEASDVAQLAGWGVDFWKYDNCYTPCLDNPRPQTCLNPAGNTRSWYSPMRDAVLNLNAQDTRKIHFNLCNWGRDAVWEWGAQYGHSWRMSVDNWGDWESVERIGSAAASISEYSGPGGFNDLDMLYLGSPELSPNQERLHFGLWAIAKSPLVLGLDLSTISNATLDIIRNKGLIDINQDALGKAATTFRPPGSAEPVSGKIYPYWAGPLDDGVVVGLCAANEAGTYSVEFKDVPGLGGGEYAWEEMYSGETGTGEGVSFDIDLHDMRVVKVTKADVTPGRL